MTESAHSNMAGTNRRRGESNGLRSDAARNRVRVLEIARGQLLAGDTSLQLNNIARLAGVGVGTVYRHFPTRRSLLEALAAQSFTQLVETARAACAQPDAGAGLRQLLEHALILALEDDGLALVLASPDFETMECLDLGEELTGLIDTMLRRARRAGAIRKSIKADDIRRMLVGTVYALRAGSYDRARIRAYLDVWTDGLRIG
jgi:AcrR family transcriptional regulator